MSSLVHSSSPLFNIIRNSSMECIERVEKEAAGALFNLAPPLTAQQKQPLCSILSKVQNFSHLLKEILTGAVEIIRYPCFIVDEDEQKAEAVTALEVLKSLVGSIRRFTDESLESIGKEASETLIEVTLQLQELEKELDEAKVSARFYNAIFSALVMAFAALVAPVATLAVVPFLQRFDLVWEDVMEKPIVDKLKVFQTLLFKTHSAIAVAGKVQDSVYRLSSTVSGTAPALHYYSQLGCNYLECSKLPSFMAEGMNGEMFKFKECVVVSGDIKCEEGVEEGACLLGGFFTTEDVGDVSKGLVAMEKVVADTMAQVEMAEHELEQLIQALALMPLQEEE